MTSLRTAVRNYIEMRRNLGFKMVKADKNLFDFITFLEQKNETFITQSSALIWAQKLKTVSPASWAQRLQHVRKFAHYRSAYDPRTEIPMRGLLPFKYKRAVPYIYTEQEIKDLLQAALSMPYRYKTCALLPMTYYCFFGLLSVTGLRLSEGRNLELRDVDLKAGVLTIRNSKFGKTRLVPLHPSTCKVLANYITKRRTHWKKYQTARRQLSSYLFTTSRGKPLHLGKVHLVFYELSRQIGLRGLTDSHGPRTHDMRHRFATCTLINWYKAGEDPERLLPHLSTYLGHIDIVSTGWYLESCPALMTEAMSRLNQYWEDQS